MQVLNEYEQERLNEAKQQYKEVQGSNMLIGIACFIIAFFVLVFTMVCIGGVFMLPLTILFYLWKGFLWLIQM